jgi:pimeloyl-ACP methyl ester carboxylesterase
MIIEVGTFLGRLPFAKFGSTQNPILILNGGQGFMMKPDEARLRKDAKRLARLLPEKRNFILLAYDPEPESVTVSGMAQDVRNIIENLGGQVDLLGISYGAVIATRVAAQFPEKVRSLVLLSGAHDFSEAGKHRLLKQIDLVHGKQMTRLIQDFTSLFRRRWLNVVLNVRIALSAKRLVRRLGRESAIADYLHAVLVDALPASALAAVSARTLVIGGGRDQFFGGQIEACAKAIANSNLILFDSETHMVPIERARDVSAELATFLALQD